MRDYYVSLRFSMVFRRPPVHGGNLAPDLPYIFAVAIIGMQSAARFPPSTVCAQQTPEGLHRWGLVHGVSLRGLGFRAQVFRYFVETRV